MQAPPPPNQPPVAAPIQATTPQPPKQWCCMKALAITQFILGIIVLILGCEFMAHPGIWGGIAIIIMSIIGIVATHKYQERGLNICYMVGLICVTILSLIAGILYLITAIICGAWEHDLCLGIAVPPLILLVVEVILAITATVLTGIHLSRLRTPGVVFMQQPQAVVYAQPGVVYAPQPGVTYVHQPGAGYAQQPGVGYAPQPGAGYVQQPGVGYAPQPGYAPPPPPQQQQQAVGAYPPPPYVVQVDDKPASGNQ